MIDILEIESILRSSRPLFLNFNMHDRSNISDDVASPCTHADISIANHLVTKLHKMFSNDAIIAEDGNSIVESSSGVSWVLDPIDGTIPFMLGIPSFMVSLYRIEKDRVTHSFAYDPSSDRIFTTKDNVVYCNGKAIQVTSNTDLQGAHVLLPAYSMQALPGLYAQLILHGAYVVFQEGLLFRSTLIAAGFADATIQPVLKQYESGAVMQLVGNAGGFVMSVNGQVPQLWATNGPTVIANSKLGPPILSILQKLTK